jgi:hypothetical protein
MHPSKVSAGHRMLLLLPTATVKGHSWALRIRGLLAG